MDSPAILVPSDQLFGSEPDGDQKKLKVEPVGLEPEEQVRAEDDRKRSESERIRVATRPGEQRVKRVRKYELPGDERRGLVHLRPVPAPVREDAEMRAGLNVVLLAERHLNRQRTTASPCR